MVRAAVKNDSVSRSAFARLCLLLAWQDAQFDQLFTSCPRAIEDTTCPGPGLVDLAKIRLLIQEYATDVLAGTPQVIEQVAFHLLMATRS